MAHEGASLPVTLTMTHTQTGVKTTSTEENADDELVTWQDYWQRRNGRALGAGGDPLQGAWGRALGLTGLF